MEISLPVLQKVELTFPFCVKNSLGFIYYQDERTCLRIKTVFPQELTIANTIITLQHFPNVEKCPIEDMINSAYPIINQVTAILQTSNQLL